jgi:amino acid adenylation domain-containing protein
VPVILTRQHLLGDSPVHTAKTICLDTEWGKIGQERETNPVSGVTPENLAYIIYTSGSTGNPKGVMIEHRPLVNYIVAASDEFEMKPGDRILQFASINFDTSAEEIYTPLIRGATLVLRTGSTLDSASSFLQQCREWQLTILGLPTAYWHELTMSIANESLCVPDHLRLVVIGGEKAMPEHIKRWQRCVGAQVRLLNAYGPTENTISATMHDVSDPANANTTESSIGRPIRNVQAYLLDKHLQLVPIGVPGELHLSGAGLARGYLNNPKYTGEKFIPNPFSAEPHSRLYKTGDLVRYAPDGNIEFLGRVDHQVKIRGFRIELEEIETALNRHPAVRENLVVAREEAGWKDLVAYLTLDPSSKTSVSDLRQFLKQQLPEYMVPASFVVLDEFPMTPNGKLDRKALPAPDLARPEQEQEYVAPRDEVEERLAGIFAGVLKLERVGIHDNFFELGGHSLLAIQVISRLRETFLMEIPVNSLFANPTVMDLAEHIRTIRMVLYDMQPIHHNTTGDYEEEEL